MKNDDTSDICRVFSESWRYSLTLSRGINKSLSNGMDSDLKKSFFQLKTDKMFYNNFQTMHINIQYFIIIKIIIKINKDDKYDASESSLGRTL